MVGSVGKGRTWRTISRSQKEVLKEDKRQVTAVTLFLGSGRDCSVKRMIPAVCHENVGIYKAEVYA